jgi:hypothetical protein
MFEQQAAAAGATNARSSKRKLTKEELADISRANGAKSRGATSAEGAAKARRGNYRHGLRCEVLPLEAEDGGAIAATVHNWYSYYKPSSPIAHTLVKMGAQSEIMLDRCYTFIGAALDGQGKEVLDAWLASRHGLVAEAVALLPTAAPQGVGILKRCLHGCRWLLDEWTGYHAALLRDGYWPLDVWPEIVRLLGASSDLDEIGASDQAFLLALYNFQCQPQPATGPIAELCAPWRQPAALAHLRLPAALPGPEECRRRLRTIVASTIYELRKLEADLAAKEQGELESILKKALMLCEGESSRQFLRYFKEWRSAFFRVAGVLPLALQRDASGFFDELAAASEDDEPPDPPLSPRESPGAPGEGRVRAEGPLSAGATEEAEGQTTAAAPQPLSPWERVLADAPPSAVASERLPAGAVRASAPTTPPDRGSDAESGPAPADLGHAPSPAEAAMAMRPTATEPVEHAQVVVEQPPIGDAPGGALPASAGVAVGEAASAPDRVSFPDPPSSAPGLTMPTEDCGALPASAGAAVADAAGAPDRVGFPDPPSIAPAVAIQTNNARRVATHDPVPDEPGSRGQPLPTAARMRPLEHRNGGEMGPALAPHGLEAAARSISGRPQAPQYPPDRAPPTVRGAPSPADGPASLGAAPGRPGGWCPGSSRRAPEAAQPPDLTPGHPARRAGDKDCHHCHQVLKNSVANRGDFDQNREIHACNRTCAKGQT